MKIDEVVAEFVQRVEQVENAGEKAGEARTIKRKLVSVNESLTKEFKQELSDAGLVFEADPVMEFLSRFALEATDEDKAVLKRIQRAVEAAEDIGWNPADAESAKELMQRFYDALARGTKGNSTTSRPETRHMGIPLSVDCACGWDAESRTGDWTGIRWRVRGHARECDKANPGLGDGLTNDLDRIREAIVTRRETPVESGGLKFRLG